MNKYISREIQPILKKYLKKFKVVGLTGPRQSGKSTVLSKTLPDYRYVTFDDDRIRQQFYDDPENFIATFDHKVIFDEVQKVPEIFEKIKIMVDRDNDQNGKFILTGSSQFYFFKKVSESLAGRIGLLTLLPFQYTELPDKFKTQSIYCGSYPELTKTNYEDWEHWLSSYIDSYIHKDIRDLINIGSLRDFRRLIQLLAANTSQILNMSTYAADLGVDVKTIKNWISILEASYIVFLLPPFYENYGKRIVKSPKLYFYDTGLVSYLTGVKNETLFKNGPMAGGIFENYIVSEIMKKELHHKTLSELFYLRTSQGKEIDLIIDRKSSKEIFEIKLNSTYTPKMVKTLNEFKQESDIAYLLYTGEDLPDKNINITHYSHYLSSL